MTEQEHDQDGHADGGHHHGPREPDTSGLWVDDSWAQVADDVARQTFTITVISVGLFIGVVLVWILL